MGFVGNVGETPVIANLRQVREDKIERPDGSDKKLGIDVRRRHYGIAAKLPIYLSKDKVIRKAILSVDPSGRYLEAGSPYKPSMETGIYEMFRCEEIFRDKSSKHLNTNDERDYDYRTSQGILKIGSLKEKNINLTRFINRLHLDGEDNCGIFLFSNNSRYYKKHTSELNCYLFGDNDIQLDIT
ncbi:hypothetical protein SAMN02745945_02962 [Peptoclostridium litorale DSM 5388]|uniref:Uncharacterized protein n=1 Tax=Peptoclostridium litorale DSM 5388 TaxID=1121324 RepID=A0A069RID5_PEPLI|nr:hypothetical protein [Peptoclostridium litorale]KDR96789.1 hypothetical protein CLIT_20p00020 [Peptoclostridium litorale DSM 5388]SIO36575.1 hypothetical protein SAMN02745945_02962 [Peptoclostridium litorale DSM 5388]